MRLSFGELLERRLNSRGSALRYRVINGGVQGYGPVHELLFLRSLLPVVKPDLIIETLFVGNDIEDAFSAEPLLEPRQRPLTEAVRGSPRFGRLPIVLVTARSKPEDKARGLQVGASAYLVKSAFDQTHLLETLRQLL